MLSPAHTPILTTHEKPWSNVGSSSCGRSFPTFLIVSGTVPFWTHHITIFCYLKVIFYTSSSPSIPMCFCLDSPFFLSQLPQISTVRPVNEHLFKVYFPNLDLENLGLENLYIICDTSQIDISNSHMMCTYIFTQTYNHS